jgi:hypothetical protein
VEGSDVFGCPQCGSTRAVEIIQGDWPTGVTAPDGGSERRLEHFVRCLDCGYTEDVS